MTVYEIVVFLHVVSVIIWLGGGVLFQILMWRAGKSGPEAIRHFTEAAEWTGQRIFMPISFVALGTGIWATIVGPWSFSDTWITIGLTGFFISAIIGSAIIGPTAKKMKARIAERGPNDPVVTQLTRRIDLAGRVDLIVMVAVVFDMVVKPGV